MCRNRTKTKGFYEVFVKLMSNGKELGKSCIQMQANSPFMAALEASKVMEGRYGENIVTRTIRVTRITEDEFLYCMAA